MLIRTEGSDDPPAIRDLVRQAFAGAAHASGTEADIVDGLRASGALSLALVAVDAGLLVGYAAFSPVTIAGRDRRWVGLGPLAVHPDRQGRGIGGRLVREGFERLRQAGTAGSVVLGDPDYYGRLGFVADPRLRYAGAPAEYFLSRSFAGPPPAGDVRYHPAFDTA